MRSKRRARRRAMRVWASWCLASWVAACTACYLYIMTADQLGRWLRTPDIKQVAETHVKDGP